MATDPAPRWIRHSLIGAVLLLTPTQVHAQCARDSSGQIATPDGAALDGYGSAVALTDDWIAVGASGANGGIGAVYLYDRGPSPTQHKVSLAGSADFGQSVALWEDWLAVGDPAWNANQGRVELFHWDGASWNYDGGFQGLAGTAFGHSVSLSNGRLVIGSPDEGLTGAAHLYEFNGLTWSFETKLTPFQGVVNGRFGVSVSYQDPVLVIGNPSASSIGHVHFYSWDGNVLANKGREYDPDGDVGGQFGLTVDTDGLTTLVGKPLDSESGSFAGAAYWYGQLGSEWTYIQKLTPPPGSDSAQFGHAIALDYDVAVVAGPVAQIAGQVKGMVRQYRVASGTGFVEQATMTGNSTNNLFGYSVAVDDQEVIAGAPFDTGFVPTAGTLYRFPNHDLELQVRPQNIPLFGPVLAESCGGTPGDLFGLFVTGVDGLPIFVALSFGNFQADGSWQLFGAHMNPAHSGLNLELMGLSTGFFGGMIATNRFQVELL